MTVRTTHKNYHEETAAMTDFLVMQFADNKLHFPRHGCMLTWLATMMAPSSGDIGVRGMTSGLATVPQGATVSL